MTPKPNKTASQLTASAPSEASQLSQRLRRLVTLRNPPTIRRELSQIHPIDLSEAMEEALELSQIMVILKSLRVSQAANVLLNLTETLQLRCLDELPPALSSQMLRFLPADDAVDMLQELDNEQSRKILGQMPFDADTQTIHHLLLEDPDSAAGLMTTDYVSVNIENTVADALNEIRKAHKNDFIYYCYLTNTEHQLVGVCSLKDLLGKPEDTPLQQVAAFNVKSILVSYDQELVVNLFRKYDNLMAIPVVEHDDTLRGIVTLDDVISLVEEEASEDIYRYSGINIEEIDEKNLLTGPTIKAVQARMPWLGITLVGQYFAAIIIASYSQTVSQATIAISFMPLLTGLTGNMGTQSDTISVRGLSQNLINRDNFWSKLRREIRVALTIGGTFALIIGALTYFQYQHWQLSLLLMIWVTCAPCFSAAIGMTVPYLYKTFFGGDPAGVGGPLITTLSDILTFSLYLLILRQFVHHFI